LSDFFGSLYKEKLLFHLMKRLLDTMFVMLNCLFVLF
jgi:hypothetical protein